MSYEVISCKKEIFPPGFEIALQGSDHFQINFIKEGKGILQINGRNFLISSGQCFIVFPQISIRYKVDENTLLCNSSICFTGLEISQTLTFWGLTPDSPVLSFDDTCRAFYYIDEIIENRNDSPGSQWRVIGNLLKIIGEIERFALTDQSREIDEHVKKALLYMEQNYTKPIAVADIAHHVCLERSYFSHHFKDNTGESPRDYLHRYRMDKAMELLLATSYNIEIVARSVGYRDSLHFSRNFKGYSGYTPTAFRCKGLRDSTQ
jgi:AraC-like DNA-binding protein